MARRTRVLVLAANPRDTPPLRLDEEVREIHAGINRGTQGRRFEILQAWAARPRDVRRALLDHAPRIVHFCGHGAGAPGLVLENDQGGSQLVSTPALAELFELCADSVECVVLNACYSQTQAECIAAHIPFVIGMTDAVNDRSAIEFAVGFYDAITAGKTVDLAFRFGCNAIALSNLSGSLVPVILAGRTARPTKQPARGVPATQHHEDRFRDHSLRIVTYDTVMSWGQSVDDLINHLLRMDYDTISSLDSTGAGNLDQWHPVVINNPDGFAFLVDAERSIVGYWHFAALQDPFFERALRGEIEDEEITVDNMKVLGLAGTYDAYIIMMAVEPQYRGYKANKLLFDAFLDRLSKLAKAGIVVRRLAANAFTAEGVGLCRSVGLQLMCRHKRRGEIYAGDLSTNDVLLRGRPELMRRTAEMMTRRT
jgi:hypothetical protein